MRLIPYTQYYRVRSEEQQAELDHCLHSNLQHPALDQIVLLGEPDPSKLPGPARIAAVQLVELAESLTYATWMWKPKEKQDALGIPDNSNITADNALDPVEKAFVTRENLLALSSSAQNGRGESSRLYRFPHWSRSKRALRSDAPAPESPLDAHSDQHPPQRKLCIQH